MYKKLIIASLIVCLSSGLATARTGLKNICRIKGQEENVLRGLGLVIGLNGTGEANDGPTMRALSRALETLGNPVATPDARQSGLEELKKAKNAVLVMVTATVPATGARRGDKVDCSVAAYNGKSLDGGQLAFASLMGPNTDDKRVYALCQGQVTIENLQKPMVGVIHGGCQLEADIVAPFNKDGFITLILDKNHADFQTANDIVEAVREKVAYSDTNESRASEEMVHAIDAANIKVRIPKSYQSDPVAFASVLMEIQMEEPHTESRVVINSRAGTIVISGDVEIGDVIVSHKNVVVDATTAPTFSAIDADQSSAPKLQTLVDQLNTLKVPTADMIEIIKGIERNGKLHGRLLIDQQLPKANRWEEVKDAMNSIGKHNVASALQLAGNVPSQGAEGASSAKNLSSQANAKSGELKEKFTQFVGEAFYGQMLKSMRSTVGKPAYFYGGHAEEVFQGQLDQTMSEHLTKSSASKFAEPMFERQFPQFAEAKPATGLDELSQLRRQ